MERVEKHRIYTRVRRLTIDYRFEADEKDEVIVDTNITDEDFIYLVDIDRYDDDDSGSGSAASVDVLRHC